MSQKDTLNKQDIKKWVEQTIIFCVIPSLIVFLNTLQTGGDFKIALLATQGTVIASLINLLGKYKSGTVSNIDVKQDIAETINPIITEPQINS